MATKYTAIIQNFKSLTRLYLWPIVTSLTILSGLEPLLYLSKLSSLIINTWSHSVALLWDFIFSIFGIEVSPSIYEPLTVSLLFLASGILYNPKIRERFGIQSEDFQKPGWYFALVANILFFFVYSTVRSASALTNPAGNLDIYISGLAFFSFITTIIVSSQKKLLRNIILTISYVVTIIILDKIYIPLEEFILYG